VSRTAQEEWVSSTRPGGARIRRRSREDAKEAGRPRSKQRPGVWRPGGAVWRHIQVRNEKGLHVRPSMMLKQLVDSHKDCEVYVQNLATNGGRSASKR